MIVRISSRGRVVCRALVELPMSASVVWGQLRDFRCSATHDPFHARITIEGGVPRRGARLEIMHRHFLWQSVRVGRILRWTEGSGFAFSDLSRSHPSCAFPHVLSYRLESVSDKTCRLHIVVGGKWTASVPRWVGRIWLWWVFSQVARTVENQMLRFALAIAARSKLP